MLNSKSNAITNYLKNKLTQTVLNPIDTLVDQNLADVVTTVGSFVIRTVRGKFQRSITFSIGNVYSDRWMEEALYGILYKYNNIKKSSRLEITNQHGMNDGTGMYYRLDDGTHNLKYRNWNILLVIQTKSEPVTQSRSMTVRNYTIITYDLSPEFVISFEKDMVSHRNSLLQIKKDSPLVSIYKDYHESDGYTYWEKMLNINKRRIGTVYLPYEQKKKLVDTINEFFGSKKYYIQHGIAHNLKILLYGPPGPQPVTIRIPCPDEGLKEMGAFNPGDKIFAIDGTIANIEDIREYDAMDVYEIRFSDGRTAKCAIDHKWPLIKGSTRCKLPDKEIDIQNLSVEEMIKEARFSETTKDGKEIWRVFEKKWFIPLQAKAQYPPIRNDYTRGIDPWTFGVLVGGMELIHDPEDHSYPLIVQMKCNDERKPVLDEFCKRMGFEAQKLDPENPKDQRWVFVDKDFHNPITVDLIIDSFPGLYPNYNTLGAPLMIPPIVRFNDIGYRKEFLVGMMDIAGEAYKNLDSIYLFLERDSLCDSANELLCSLGMKAACKCEDKSLHFYDDPVKNYDLFRYYQKGIDNCNRDYPDLQMDDCLQIESIVKLGYKEKMRCFHITHPSHIYLTENYIPTCNTGKDSIAKMIASEWNRNIYYITGGKDGKFIPNAITDNDDDLNCPLLLISDIDKYPQFITEPDIDENATEGKEEKIRWKQQFGSMINALDGILSGEDRIIIMTTNHIEKFSETFLRPGRIDLCMEIGYVTPEVFRKYVYDFYGKELPEDIVLNYDKLTIARLQFDLMYLKLTADEFIKKYTGGKK